MMYPIEKYRFDIDGNTVVAVSTFAKKPVRGIAKCDPRDEFNLEKGKKLAAARCNYKIAQKRMNRALQKVAEAEQQYLDAELHLDKMSDYLDDAIYELSCAEDTLIELNNHC